MKRSGHHEVVLDHSECAGCLQDPSSQLGVTTRGGHWESLEQPRESLATLTQMAASRPEPPEGDPEPERGLGVAMLLAPGERRAEVVVLLVEPSEPGALVRTIQLVFRRLSQLGHAEDLSSLE